MRLSRRDALLSIGGVKAGATLIGSRGDTSRYTDAEVASTLHAVAEAIYPSDVEIESSFIETYVLGRLEQRRSYIDGQLEAIEALNSRSRDITGQHFPSLSVNRRKEVLRTMGIHRAPPVPDGTLEERIRFYVVNDLLFVFYSTPTGSALVGCQNPPGFPGGRDAYQQRNAP